MNLNLQVWRQAGPNAPGPAGGLRGQGHLHRHVVPRDARRRQRGPHQEGRGPDRVRLGLPRGHLRHVRPAWSTASRTARTAAPPSASCTCGASRTATRSRSSRGARRPSPSSRTSSSTARAFDRIIRAGGYISINVGRGAGRQRHPDPEGPIADEAMDFAACIGCGACVAACKNASAALFTSAKISHLALLPQGQVERDTRVVAHGRADGRRGLRQLLERGRVRGRVPEGDPHRRHRAHEPRVPARHAGSRRAATAGRRPARGGLRLTHGRAGRVPVRPSRQGRPGAIPRRPFRSSQPAEPTCDGTSASRLYTPMMSVSSFTAAADLSSAAFSSSVSVISMICSTPFAPELHRHADEQVVDPVLALQVDRARQDLLLVLEDRLDHLDGRRRRRVVGAAGLEQLRRSRRRRWPCACTIASIALLRQQLGDRDARHGRVARQRHHRVAVAAEHERVRCSRPRRSAPRR